MPTPRSLLLALPALALAGLLSAALGAQAARTTRPSLS
jgi:hypothetical protein